MKACKRGHDLSAPGAMIATGGANLACRLCRNQRQRAYNAANRASRKRLHARGTQTRQAVESSTAARLLDLCDARERAATHWERAAITERIQRLQSITP